MKVTQEKLPASQVGLEIEITPEKTKESYEKVIKNLASTANIPGFRKGKVPRQILIQRMGVTRIKAAALEELIQDGIEKAIKQEEVKAIGQPKLRSSFEELIGHYEPGKTLTFSAAVDVQPEVEISNYTGLQLKAEEVKYDPQRVEEVLDGQQQQMATLIPIEERAAQLGDVAVVDFKGVIAAGEGEDPSTEPEPIPGGEATDFQVELQEDKFIPGFVTGMVGMNPGETREISAQFPDPYANEELAGKPAIFTVTLKELKEKELPELNDEFAQEVSDFETFAELQSSLEERFQKEAEQKTKSNKQEALLAELVKHVEVDLPETMIQEEVDAMLTQTAYRLSQQGIDIKKLFTQEMIPQLRERSREEAVERIKRSISLQEIGKRESIEVSPEAVQARVKELLEQYGDREVDPERLQEVVQNELQSEQIMDWLLERSNVELVPEGSLSAQTAEEEENSEVALAETVPVTEAEFTQPASEQTVEVQAESVSSDQ
ncbi:trigger factor [Scytonema sp. NUACC26]|uniref:trigger factor n=1 Tax=Scytonema sp. NUACC26 TaxID=3140176 RepID=UPI0034DC16A1